MLFWEAHSIQYTLNVYRKSKNKESNAVGGEATNWEQLSSFCSQADFGQNTETKNRRRAKEHPPVE